MKNLHIILVNDNVIRSSLAELPSLTGASYWLVASPHYLRKLPDTHRRLFACVLEQEDFSTPALTERLAAALGAAPPWSVEFLTNDESCELACVELQERFGEPRWTTEQVLPFVNKVASKRRLAGCDVRLPRHVEFSKPRFASERGGYCQEIAEALGFPMIAKPVDRYASMDVRRIDSAPELRAWATWSSSPKDRNTYEIDEFVEGTLFHCDSLVRDGVVLWSNACRNVNPCLQFASGRSIGAYMLPPDHEDAVAVRDFNARVLAALDPPDGATHLECFKTGSGELVFLEVAARPPGGDVVGLYRRCLGLNVDVAHFALRAGIAFEPRVRRGSYGAWAIHPKRGGRVVAIDLPALRCEHRIELNVAVGDTIAGDSRRIVEEPAAEFWLYSPSFVALDRDCDVLRELELCAVEA